MRTRLVMLTLILAVSASLVPAPALGLPWRYARASWYGPGLYGNHVAWSRGGYLTPHTLNFAHRTMRFGTRVRFRWHGCTVIATCTDRGPFVRGRTFDLGPGTARALRFTGVGTVGYTVLAR